MASALPIIDMVIIMKIKESILLVFMALLFASQMLFVNAKAADGPEFDDPVRLNDMIITLLMPPISEAVSDFYEPYLTGEPTVVPSYGSKIVSIRGGISNSHYTATVEVFPYVGPHQAVGKDRITLDIQPDGVAVINYEHVESYALTPNYQSLIKEPLP